MTQLTDHGSEARQAATASAPEPTSSLASSSGPGGFEFASSTKSVDTPRAQPDSCPAGTFFDPRGECWSCPSGHHRTIFPVTASNACERRVQVIRRPVSGKMKATGLIKTDCKSGWFLHQLSGVCYQCPKGFNRTIFGVESNSACERIEGPKWTAAMLHKKITCGENGNRACTVLERLPSCDPGLKERRGVCVPLEPGELPFLAGVGEAGKHVAELGGEACRSLLGHVPSIPLRGKVATMSIECTQRAVVGFTCELPGILDQISQYTDLAAKTAKAYEQAPCSNWIAAARPLCAAAVATLGDAPEVLTCVGAAIEAGVLGKANMGNTCEAAGQIAFQVATMRKLGDVRGKGAKETKLDMVKRLLGNTKAIAGDAAYVSSQLDRIAECRGLDR